MYSLFLDQYVVVMTDQTEEHTNEIGEASIGAISFHGILFDVDKDNIALGTINDGEPKIELILSRTRIVGMQLGSNDQQDPSETDQTLN